MGAKTSRRARTPFSPTVPQVQRIRRCPHLSERVNGIQEAPIVVDPQVLTHEREPKVTREHPCTVAESPGVRGLSRVDAPRR